jgi:HSP20 family protein
MPWDPARDLLTMKEQLDSLLGRAASGWVPAADLHETSDRYVLTLELPGLTKAQIHVQCHGRELAVSGDGSPAECPQRFHQLERGHGAFSRVFQFGQDVDGGNVTAELADGVLTVVVPKTVAATSRRIDVQ